MSGADSENAKAGMVAIVDLADELGVRKQRLFKVANRLGIRPCKRREVDRGNQLVSAVSAAEAAVLGNEILTANSPNAAPSEAEEMAFADAGVFYLVQLEPEHDPGRLKVGFTTDIDGRLRKHRCAAPFAACLASWPCRRTWERAAIDSVTAGLEQLHTEIFRADSLEEVARRGDRFFSVMPAISVVSDVDDEDSALDGEAEQ